MAKIEKEVQKFIKSYHNGPAIFWKVTVPNGTGGQIRKQGFLKKKDATDYATETYLRILQNRKGLKLSTSSLIFKDYTKIWLESKGHDLSEASLMRYRQEIDLRLNLYFGSIRISDLEKRHLRDFITDLRKAAVKTSVLSFSVMVFKSILKQAELDDLVSPKGIGLIQTPKHRKKLPKFWDQKEVQYFLNAKKNDELFELWSFALYSGLRAGEISGLKWDAVRFDWSFGDYVGAITVKRSFNQKTRKMQETTKNGEHRIVPMLPQTKELLKRLAQNRKGEFVFGEGIEPLDSSHFNRQLRSALLKLPENQIPLISFHSLRHTFCSYLDSTGMSRRIVAEIMGHKDLNTTNRYSHVNSQMLGYEMKRWSESQNKQKTNNLEVVNF